MTIKSKTTYTHLNEGEKTTRPPFLTGRWSSHSLSLFTKPHIGSDVLSCSFALPATSPSIWLLFVYTQDTVPIKISPLSYLPQPPLSQAICTITFSSPLPPSLPPSAPAYIRFLTSSPAPGTPPNPCCCCNNKLSSFIYTISAKNACTSPNTIVLASGSSKKIS